MSQGLNEQGFDALYVYAIPEIKEEFAICEISISASGIVL